MKNIRKIFEFRDKGVQEYLGDIYDYLHFKKLKSLRELEKKSTENNTRPRSSSRNKEHYERNKQLDRDIRKLNTQISKSETRIDMLENELAEIDSVLMDPEKHKDALSDPEVFNQYNSIKTALDKEMEEWEVLHKKLEDVLSEQSSLRGS